MQAKIAVREAMTRDVTTAKPIASMASVAKLMVSKHIGCVVIADKEPLGVVTEADIVKIVSEGKDPKKIKAKDVMSSPVISITPDSDVIDSARKMARYNIRHLPVIRNKKLLGIATSHDMLRVASEEEELLSELVDIRLSEIVQSKKHRHLSGECENCRNYTEFLREIDGRLVCPECTDLEQ